LICLAWINQDDAFGFRGQGFSSIDHRVELVLAHRTLITRVTTQHNHHNGAIAILVAKTQELFLPNKREFEVWCTLSDAWLIL
jgi:hypothetical protein